MDAAAKRYAELTEFLATEWPAANHSLVIVDVVVTQSSDDEFHCLAMSAL